MKKKISILGSTGSIGRQALEVVKALSDEFEVVGLAAGSNIALLKEQVEQFKPQYVSVRDESNYKLLKKELSGVNLLCGSEGLVELASNRINDVVLISVTGISGLYPTLAAIENGIDVALANKETLVAAGSIVMQKAKSNNVKILPVDSEHSAILQCINGSNYSEIRKLVVTASGGPFRTKSFEEIKFATLEETLSHPNWSMGDKITVDSATLMNKGLEVIEAHWLFGIDYQNIDVVIHPQSIVHSAVEFVDGSIIAQLGLPSMHIPIQYALTYPKRIEGIKTESFNLFDVPNLEFEKPDFFRFPCLRLAYEAGIKGGTYPTVLNAINEEAVYAFLSKKICVADIPIIVEKGLEKHKNTLTPTLEQIIDADNQARIFIKEFLPKV